MTCRTTHYACDCVLERLDKYEKALEAVRENLLLAMNPKFRRDFSKLASNPAQNGAVYDIQVLVNKALKKLDELGKEEK